MPISARTAALIALLLLSTGCPKKYEEALGPDAGRFERSRLWSYPDERWDDPAVQKEARLQFVWGSPDEKIESIFSIRLDGNDLRRVIGPDRLYTGEAKRLQQTPVRSPNRRYIACVGEDAQGDELRFLVDLKTRTVRTMMKATNRTTFSWTPDSRSVLFYGDDRLRRYDLETGTLSILPNMGPYGLHLVDGGSHFVALRDHAVELRDPAGKLLKTIKVPWRTESEHVVSADGRLIAFQEVPFVIIDLERPRTPIFTSKDLIWSPTFAPAGDVLFYFTEYLNSLDIASGEVKKLARIPSPIGADDATTLLPVKAG